MNSHLTPMRSDLVDALCTGDVEEAQRIAVEYLDTVRTIPEKEHKPSSSVVLSN